MPGTIEWQDDHQAALAAAAAADRPALVCAYGPGKGSERLREVTWSDPRVIEMIGKLVVPFAFEMEDDPALCERHGIVWRPTVLLADGEGRVGHRVIGYLPGEEMLAQIPLGIGKLRFVQTRWADAEKHFAAVAEEFPGTEAAPEAQYWLGAARYQRERKPNGLTDAWNTLMDRWPASRWAMRASVIRES
jgi:hypothetical protein